ncbi:MAG: DinB family protein [Chitinophagaceae bacterium]
MPTFSTQTLFRAVSNSTEQLLHTAIEQWQNTPTHLLEQPPAPGKWSAVQCLHHLNMYFQYYNPAMRKAIQNFHDCKPTNTFNPGWLGSYFTKSMLTDTKSGLPTNTMKSPAKTNPTTTPPTAEVLQDFIEHLHDQLQIIELARQVNLNKVRVPISIMPLVKLKLGDTLLFNAAHQIRHAQQLIRTLPESYQTKLASFRVK